MIVELAIATHRLPSEWELEEPAAIFTALEVLETAHRKSQPK